MRLLLLSLFVTGCGLYDGGATPTDTDAGGMPDTSMDVAADLNVEDRGMGMTDSGAPCTCISNDAKMNGWTYVGANLAKGTCPMDWDGPTSTALLQGPTAMGYTCTCQCTKADPSCAVSGNINFTYYANNMCSLGANAMSNPVTPNTCNTWDQGGLGSNSTNDDEWVKVSLQNAPTTNGTCTPQTTKQNGTITTTDVQLCAFKGMEATCMNGSACIPEPAMPYRMCVWKMGAGPFTCPTDFPAGTDGVSTGPTYIGDTIDSSALQCPSCNCSGAPGTCSMSVATWSDASCGSTKYYQIPADGTCQSTTQNGTYRPKSFYLSVTPQLTCSNNGYGMPAQTGAPKLSGNVYAVCCRP